MTNNKTWSQKETDKQVYLFCQEPYNSNADYMEAFKAHLKVSESQNGVVVYHPVLASIIPQEKQNITSDAVN